MTIDEAIKHCLEVAEQNETSAITYKNCKKIKTNMYEKLTAKKAENDCRECAAEHRQLAEWLRELKEAKRLLKATTSDIHDMLTERFGVICEFCKWYDSKNADCAKPRNGSGAWCCEYGCSRYADKVKELLGETNDEP